MIFKLIKVLIYIIALFLLSCAALFIILYMQVSRETSELMERGAIKNTVFSESPVYYDDGITPIGVFFEKTHSKYLSYNEIPRIYIKAIIASEDKNFFKHHGFDFKAIVRAFFVNYKAGKVIQGGSTITQQTAKNIFKRERKTYLIKLKELIQSLLIEKNYSKEEILEIYINQFFVTGFGKGLGVASEYFFDKDPKDLNLVEAAFLAGMVKGPYRYNPFGKTDEEKNDALRLSKNRKDYVLEKMKLLNMITEDEYVKARDQEVPFKEGRVTYGLNVAMDYIRRQLESEYFRNILSEHGLDNIATSGINIYTSISQTMQEGALNSIRKQLPILDIQLSGYDKKLNEERYMEKMGMIYKSPMDNLPFFCNISVISDDINNIYMEVKWENDGEGVIDYEGLKPIGDAWVKWKYGSYTSFDKKYALEFLSNFQIGDTIPVLFMEKTGETPMEEHLFLWEIPDLEGGVIVLNNGMIKAMAGGFFDRHFNRAADAKRQLGSIFKPIVYTAALQLKWNNLDPLTNIYDIYEFENTFYIPRPDHDTTSNAVSMLWAGVKSENLASVWLLYHLTDRLNRSEFKQVAERLGLARKESETYQDYVKRIRDKHGVIVNENSLREAAFEEAKKDMESDLIFGGDEKAIENLNRLHFDISQEDINSQIKKDVEISRFSFNRLFRMNSDLKKSIGSGVYSKDIWVDDLLPSWIMDLLQLNMDKRYEELLENEKYDIDVLYYVRDFRTLVNLFYVRQLAIEMGVSTPLDTVLSFPLGANSISILEAALAYNTIMNGKLNFVTEEGSNNEMVPVISRITDRKGDLIWEYMPEPKRILSSTTSGSVTEILRMAVENGTARRAKDSVKLSTKLDEDMMDVIIPAYGKTGTSNQFSNSSFAGFIPGIQKGDFSLDKGYVIASYVGYDDNMPMKGPYMMIYGASGALPIWIDTANAVVNSSEYKKDVEVADFAFNIDTSPLVNKDILNPVKISPVSGLPLSEGYLAGPDAVNVYSNIDNTNEDVTLKRAFEPLGGVDSDDQQ
jgi:penicillin-binding protein 1A